MQEQPRHAPDGNRDASLDPTDRDSSINPVEPKELIKHLGFVLPDEGLGKDGLTEMLEKILQYSVNTWNQGFLHKLYATTNPIGVVSELILAVLNTNVRTASDHNPPRLSSLDLSRYDQS